MDNISEFIGHFQMPELFIMLGVGLAVLLFGYRLKKIAFFIIWFLLGFIGVTYLMPEIIKLSPEIASNDLYQTLIPIGGGLLLALLGFSIEKLCVGGICFVLVMLVSTQYFGAEMQTLAMSAVVGVVAAGAAVMLMKPATIIATAAAGAYAITLALLALIPNLSFGEFYWPLIIGIAAAGSIFQFLTTKRVS
ncbi:MAG: DUF4203 domain-containing protein [Candidatus Saccharibacteria bacterium]|nr:DUF4203 domain-containing protein [Candidatus Saccharibacteria bacterium]